SFLALILVFAVSITLPAQTPAPALPSEATVNEFLESFFGFTPGLSWKVNLIRRAADPALVEVSVMMTTPDGDQPMRLYVTPDGRHAVAGDWLPFGADPFAGPRKEIAERATGPAKGPATAAVTIVEFGDLQCPSCKAAQPAIEDLLKAEPQVRFIFQHFPLTQIHPWAFKAATWAQCVSEQSNGAFWKFVDTVYAEQEKITVENADARLGALAEKAGANRASAAACAPKPETAAKINQSIELGKSLEVGGTPTVFIGGRKISNVNGTPLDVLKAIVDHHAAQKK
ncbi:MAG TPA: thioredoxin domain-containing protein, partial [Terriglobales bacterium]|nr:thioredoxin domain-containing protein [Terriglobales bacterium]